LETVSLYRKEVIVYWWEIVDPVDQTIGILVTDFDVDEVVVTHLLFSGRPLP
jgi:hypothetical protein